MDQKKPIPQSPVVNKQDIIAGLRSLGLCPGDIVMVHSSLSSMGFLVGGADTVIDALLDVIGPAGTLAMPTLCQKDKERRFETWNIATSPSDVGRITETFRLRPDVVRSDHATHSVAAFGAKAVELTAGHKTSGGRPSPWGPAAFGHGSPWEKFYEWNVRYVFLGVSMRVNTMRHFVQSRIVEDRLNALPPDRRSAFSARLQGWCTPGVWPNYDDTQMEERLTALSLIRFAAIGAATVRLLQARDIVDHSRRILESEPDRWFDANFLAWYREIKP
jgi:aminoglycoside 3-N-acetyltransferase